MYFKVSPLFGKVWDAINSGSPNIVNEGTTRSTKTWTYFQVLFLYSLTNPQTTVNILRDTAISCRKILEKEFREWANDPQARMAFVKLLQETNLDLCNKGLKTKEQADKENREALNEAIKLMKKESLMVYMKENKSTHTWHFGNGSMLNFDGTDDIQKVMGMASTIAWLNEPYTTSEEIYNQVSQRTSKVVLIDWNPKESHWIDDVKKKKDTTFIFSTWRDNPFLGIRQIKDILRHQMVRQAKVVVEEKISEADAFKYDFKNNPLNFTKGEIAELKRTIYNQSTSNYIEDSAWHWTVFGEGKKAERPGRIFKWSEIQYNEYLDIDAHVYYGVDWGNVDPFAVVEVKYYDGCLYVHELNYTNENKLIQMYEHEIDHINEQGGIITKVFRDAHVRKDRPIICDSNKKEKIFTLRDWGWDYAIATNKYPGSIVDGIGRMKQLKIFYTNTSHNTRLESESYAWKKGRDGSTINEAEDANNHICDSVRYVVQFLVEEGIIKIV